MFFYDTLNHIVCIMLYYIMLLYSMLYYVLVYYIDLCHFILYHTYVHICAKTMPVTIYMETQDLFCALAFSQMPFQWQ